MKRAATKIPWTLALIALAALLIYGFWPQPVEVDVAQVTRGSLEVTVNDDGETRIREKYIVSAPVAGKLLRVQLDAGDVVEQGKTELARIQPSDPRVAGCPNPSRVGSTVASLRSITATSRGNVATEQRDAGTGRP